LLAPISDVTQDRSRIFTENNYPQVLQIQFFIHDNTFVLVNFSIVPEKHNHPDV